MDRLTKVYENGRVTIDAAKFGIDQAVLDSEVQNSKAIAAAVANLREYEDAEEQGLLAHLPCKVGDTVYILAGCSRSHYLPNKYEQEICEGYYIGDDGIVQIRVSDKKYNHGTYGVMGKTVFLTHEAAQQALKARESE